MTVCLRVHPPRDSTKSLRMQKGLSDALETAGPFDSKKRTAHDRHGVGGCKSNSLFFLLSVMTLIAEYYSASLS